MLQNKTGSILIYTLFLTSFIVLFFVAFQWELEKKLEWAKGTELTIRSASNTKDALILLKKSPSEKIAIGKENKLSLTSETQSWNIFTESLDGSGSKEYWLSGTGNSIPVVLRILEWGPISYSLAGFNSGSEASATLISSGIITSQTSIALNILANQHILVIDPLWWRVKYSLDMRNTPTIPATSSYVLKRNTGWYNKNEWVYDIMNFAPKSRTNFPYIQMGMYLKE